jgi:DNA-binding GntR family transcriptional regulator
MPFETHESQEKNVTIERSLLRDQVKSAVVDLVLGGDLDERGRINELELATRLGVSRTPLREALLGLQEEGVVQAFPGKGFSIIPLSTEEARELYPIVAALEGLAINAAETLPDLELARELNDRMLAARDDDRLCLQLDAEFHRCLVQGSTNQRLRDLLAGQRRLMDRYEAAYMRYTAAHPDSTRTMETSVREHEVIIEALARGDRDAAVVAVEANWRNGMERLLEILSIPESRP